jgi:NADH-quinone oxidoreductase subunit A
MGEYLPIVMLAGLAIVFGLLVTGVTTLLAPKKSSSAKIAPYECGIVPTRQAPARFPVSFYLVAMLFIMFDIEIIFLYPYAVAHEQLGGFGFGAIMFFSVVFFLSFVYEVGKGGLDWGPIAQARRLSDAVTADRTLTNTVRRVGLEGREDAA